MKRAVLIVGIAGALAAAVVSPSALGQGGESGRRERSGDRGDWLRMFGVFGQEGAAMIPRAVMVQGLLRSFGERDADGDGRLSSAEAGSDRWMQTFDRDSDGGISREDLEGWLETAKRAAGLPSSDPEAEYPFLGSDADPRRKSPRRIAPGPSGIGSSRAPAVDVTVCGGEGESVPLASLAGERGTVVALVSPSCPVSRRYVPVLRRLEDEYAGRGVAFVFVAASEADSDDDLTACGFRGPVVRDPSGRVLRALGARTTVETFLLDARRTLVYRGAIDDQYGVGYSLPAAGQRFLAPAIDALLAGRPVAIAATEAPACELEVPPASVPAEPLTWHNRISRIVQAHCLECHTDDGSGPFALETREQVAARARTIARVIDEGVMPPWFAESDGHPSPWINDRSMPERDRDDFLTWLAGDRPAGNPDDAPVPRAAVADWAIGTPDLIVELPEPVEVQAEGTMPWVNVIVDPGIDRDRWAGAMEVQPTARGVVHHVLIFVQPPDGQGLPSIGPFSGDEIDGFFAAWAPGTVAADYPDGFARHLPAGSKLRFQIHYTPNGTATRDRTRLGIRFVDGPPRHRIETIPLANVLFAIPPGHPSFPVNAAIALTSDVRVLSLTPHMHVRGKAFRFDAAFPDGRERTLVRIPRYDFNWQVPCAWADPPLLPAGTRLRATGWFDNSRDNPLNPDPAATVRWGQRTADEMMLGYLQFYRELPAGSPPAETAGAATGRR